LLEGQGVQLLGIALARFRKLDNQLGDRASEINGKENRFNDNLGGQVRQT